MQINTQEKDFLKAISNRLPQEIQLAIRNSIIEYKNEEGEAFADILFSALTTLNPDEYWLLMQVDTKGLKEVEWQANALARAHGLEATFKLEGGEETLDEALQAFNDWLSIKQFVFLQSTDAGDGYFGFICRSNQAKRILRLACDAGVLLTQLPARPKARQDFMFTRKKPSQGTLGEILTQAMEQSRKKGYHTILYLAAPDCEPCMAFERMMDQPLVSGVLQHCNIMRLDAMLFGNQLRAYGINCRNVPAFIYLTPEVCFIAKLCTRKGPVA